MRNPVEWAIAPAAGLDELLRNARRGRFDVVLVWASDRIARSVRHFLEVLDEFNRLNIEFVSFREQIDTGGPLGRAIVVIIGAIAELERNLIVESRSQPARKNWKLLTPVFDRWIPYPRILHPYPDARFYASHPS